MVIPKAEGLQCSASGHDFSRAEPARFLNCHSEAASAAEEPAFCVVPEGTPQNPVPSTQRFRAGLEVVKIILVIWAALGALTLSGCDHNKKKTAKVPPPPTITASTTPSATKPQPTPPPSVEVPKNAKPIYVETGLASWYGPPYHNHKGANGEIYDQNALTAAHRTLPMNSVVRVTNENTKHAVVVRITDRGPFIDNRVIDLSLAAAKAVDVWRPGTATVKIEVLTAPAPINEGGRWCVQIGAFQNEHEARKLKEKLQDRYEDAKVIQFTGPTGEWVRIRPQGDDKHKAQEVAAKTHAKEGGVFLVRLD